MSESKFNQKFRAKMSLRGFSFYRVESHATCPGIPDNHFISADGHTGWLEMKEEPRFPTRVKYRPKQAEWLQLYARRGGECWTAIHVVDRRSIVVVPGIKSISAEVDLAHSSPMVFSYVEELAWDLIAELIGGGLNGLQRLREEPERM